MRSFLLLLALVCACASTPAVSHVRFANQPPVWQVNDRANVPEKPENRPDLVTIDGFDSSVYRRITRPMEVNPPRRARNVNALGEVPDSTWFENRIGRFAITPAQVRAGPAPERAPDLSGPLTIVKGKVGGASPGFIVNDVAGRRYILKFDVPGAPIIETATDIVVQRILWAAGYHVPNNEIAYLRADQLVRAPDATIEWTTGQKRSMTDADVAETLARADMGPDGRMRALLSEFLPGVPIGGFPQEGVRPDDPNDTIPHEHRREVRGLGLFCSWLQHTDMKEGNTLDVWAEDPVRPDHHFVVHFLVDFGKSLGAFVPLGKRPADGHTEPVDIKYLWSLLSFGLWKRPWEGTYDPGIRGVATFDAAHYRPDDFSPQAPYIPFLVADRYDHLWAAAIMLRFTPAHLRAALEAARYDDPRAVDYLEKVLVARQRKAARYHLSRVNPLVGFTLVDDGDGLSLCFVDLWRAHRLGEQRTAYLARVHDRAGQPVRIPPIRVAPDGTGCVDLAGLAPGAEGYTIVAIVTERSGQDLAPVEVHVARDPAGSPRIIGIERR